MLESVVLVAECTDEHKLILAQNLKMLDKSTCFSGESVADCFAVEESDVGMTNISHGAEYCLRACDLAFDKNVMLIYESIKLGRTLYDNIRKFMQY